MEDEAADETAWREPHDMSGEDGFVERRFSAPDGLMLSARIYGETIEDPLPAICLPGLTRNARDFHELAFHLSREAQQPRKVVAFDYRGRGRSDHDPDWRNYQPPTEAGDVAAGLTALGIGAGAFIGTSRGGLIVFALAAMRPALLKAVVLNDIGPVLEGAGLVQIRAYLERAPKPASMEEAIAIQKAALGPAFPALGDADWERATRALYRQGGDGRPERDFDPNLVRTMKGIDLNRPLPVFWPQFQGLAAIPLLAIRGEHSTLLSQETLAEMARRHESMETLTVAGQGHAPLLETGDLPQRIERFLRKADAQARR